MAKFIIFSVILFSISVFSQNTAFNNSINIKLHTSDKTDKKLHYISGPEAFLTGLIIISVINPVIVYEGKKVYIGTTRELTLGFGKSNSFRISAEYSYIFRSFLNHHFRASIKYDIQLEKFRGEFADFQTVVSIGAGYFTDQQSEGYFPEITAGLKFGYTYLFFPYIKLRHTFMRDKKKPDITDFSIGAILGLHAF